MVNYPEDWEVKKLGEIGEWESGSTPLRSNPAYYVNGNIFWVKSGELNDNILTKTEEKITHRALAQTAVKLKKPGAVIIAMYGATIGKLAILDIPATTNQACCSCEVFEDTYNKFLFYSLMFYRERIKALSAGAAQPNISKKIIVNYSIPLPPLPEQRAIADTLSTFDTHIKNLSALIEKKKAVRDGALDDLMSGRTRLKGFSGEWEEKKLGDIGDAYSGLTGKTKTDFETGNRKFITFLNVLNNTKIDINILGKVNVKENEKQNIVKIGDLFFNTSSETPEEVGMCAALLNDPGICYLNSFCLGFRLKSNNFSPLFLSYYFNGSVGRNFMRIHAQGSTRYNLSKQKFLEQSIFLPSLPEQQAIADTLTALDNEISNLEAERDKIIQIRDGAMNDLLTGKVRLIHGK